MTENISKMIKIVFAISVFSVAISVAAITFCFILAVQPNDEQIFQSNINKTVEIRILNEESETLGYGTGVFVSSDGLILTNKHMVQNSITGENYSKIEVRLPDSDDYISAELCKISDSTDLATIKIERQNCQYFSFDSNPKNGQQVYTIGNPNGFGLSFVKGNVSSANRDVLYNGQKIETIQTSLVINEGNSGGAVFTNSGKMVGIISFRLKDKNGDVIQGVAFAIPAKQIIAFLQD